MGSRVLFSARNSLTYAKKWYLVDAKDQVLGRMAQGIARVLMGKNKPIHDRHRDVGDFVVVVNARDVAVTGRKAEQKMYRWHSGYPGGLKERTFSQMLEKKPELIVRKAVSRMLPKTPQQKTLLGRLRVYADDVHPHKAQKPEPLAIPRGKVRGEEA